MASFSLSALPKYEHRTLALMLAIVHLIVITGVQDELAKPLMLAHLGLFLIWQPLLSHRLRLDTRSVILVGLLMMAIIGILNWSLLSLWLLMLIGLLSGQVNTSPRQRYANLTALVFLVLEIMIGAIPRIFDLTTPSVEFQQVFNYALGLLPVILFLIPAGGDPERVPRSVDFLHGLTGIFLILILILGGLTNTLATGTGYPLALLEMVFGMAVFLILVAWLWAPIAGFSGLGQIWERYVQNVGTPFELWLTKLQVNAIQAPDAQEFLQRAVTQLNTLPWVAGVEWRAGEDQGQLGGSSSHVFTNTTPELIISLHTHRPMGVTLMLHARLLVQMIGHFYSAKEREATLASQAHLHAIYETGARLTHDIKNLLMTGALATPGTRNAQDLNRLVSRQLPHISQRLELALDKLQSPQQVSAERQQASRWWRDFIERHGSTDLCLDVQIHEDPVIPADLFHSVADNLLENIRYKRQLETDIQVDIEFVTSAHGARLTISDNGRPIPDHLTGQLFRGIVASEAGLGIGLYQAAQQARESSYELRLAENDQRVSFELRPLDRRREAEAG